MDYVHVAADGKRYLLVHGDAFDQVTRYHRWIAILGDHTYDVLLRLNFVLSWVRRTLPIPRYWSLSGYRAPGVKEPSGIPSAVQAHGTASGYPRRDTCASWASPTFLKAPQASTVDRFAQPDDRSGFCPYPPFHWKSCG